MRIRRPSQADELRVLRRYRTQMAFAGELGITLRSYGRYESGTRRVPDSIIRLARLLDLQFCATCIGLVRTALAGEGIVVARETDAAERRQAK